jgi:antitoxin component HigA of HigAB toxin-antitoxin module
LEEQISNPSALASDGSIDRRQGGSVLSFIVDLFERALNALPTHIGTKLELALLLSQRRYVNLYSSFCHYTSI